MPATRRRGSVARLTLCYVFSAHPERDFAGQVGGPSDKRRAACPGIAVVSSRSAMTGSCSILVSEVIPFLARIMHKTPWRDRLDSRAAGQPQGLGPVAYHSVAAGSRSHTNPADAGGRDGLRRKAHPEPLPSLDGRSDPQASHHNPAQRPSLALHYQCRDYAPLQSRPPCRSSLRRGWKPLPQCSSSRSRQLGEKDGHIRGRSRRTTRWNGILTLAVSRPLE